MARPDITRQVLRIVGAAGLWVAGPSCRASIDEVTYTCIPARSFPHAESFDDPLERVRDRCWEVHDAENANVLTDQGDLIIRPNAPATWTSGTRAPSVSLHLEDDFVVVARAEPVNVFAGDHCDLGVNEVAGLVAHREAGAGGWLTLTVRPFELTVDNCGDNAQFPPRAIVERRHDGLGAPEAGAPSGVDAGAAASAENVGVDGEADIALCRQGNLLASFYRDVAATVPEDSWRVIGEPLAVDPGGLEVGLTTERGGVSMEGHFNWVVLQHLGILPSDACLGALGTFQEPAEQ